MSAAFAGLALGVGIVLVWAALARAPLPDRPTPRWWVAWCDVVTRADMPGLTGGRLVALCVLAGLAGFLTALAATRAWTIGAALGALCLPLPAAAARSRANRRALAARACWPDVVDSLVSGVRAGVGLPELLVEVGRSGPEPLRPAFAAFARDFRADGRFDAALDGLKARLADSVADRLVEALRIARQVGGADLGQLLRDLGFLLREDARVRGELEARQSWTVNAARLGVAAPWVVLVLLGTQGQAQAAYQSAQGAAVLVVGLAASVLAYLLMRRIGRLSHEERSLR